MASSDPFDDIINLEEQFYTDGHKAGVADGARAGRIEGRSFGIEKGYEKFIEAGRLYGKAIVWANRLPRQQQQQQQQQSLPALRSSGGGGARLEKNVVTLHALVEPATLSTENSDEAVNDFDERVKRAQGKARVVERQVGEDVKMKKKEEEEEGEGGAQGGGSGGSELGESAATAAAAAASTASGAAGVEF